MAGTPESGRVVRQKLVEKLGGEEAYKEYMRALAVKGGFTRSEKTFKRGFASMTKQQHKDAAALGGINSHKNDNKKKVDTE